MPSPELGLWLPNRKPQSGTVVNRWHPVVSAMGLKAAYFMTEAAGGVIHDAARLGGAASFSGSTAPTWTIAGGEPSLSFAVASSQGIALPTAQLPTSPPVCIAIRFVVKTLSAERKAISWFGSAGPENWLVSVLTNGTLQWVWNPGIASVTISTTAAGAISAGTSYTAVCWTDGTQAGTGVLLNGSTQALSHSTFAGQAAGTSGTPYIGQDQNGLYWDGTISWALIGNRPLTVGVAKAISNQPYVMLREAPQNQAWFFMSSATAGGTNGSVAASWTWGAESPAPGLAVSAAANVADPSTWGWHSADPLVTSLVASGAAEGWGWESTGLASASGGATIADPSTWGLEGAIPPALRADAAIADPSTWGWENTGHENASAGSFVDAAAADPSTWGFLRAGLPSVTAGAAVSTTPPFGLVLATSGGLSASGILGTSLTGGAVAAGLELVSAGAAVVSIPGFGLVLVEAAALQTSNILSAPVPVPFGHLFAGLEGYSIGSSAASKTFILTTRDGFRFALRTRSPLFTLPKP